MTRKVRVALFAILLMSMLVATSCDSDQPLSVEGQQVDIFFNAFAATTPLFRVWELTVDTDNDNVPDDVNGDGVSDQDDVTLWCEMGPTSANPNSVPWDYSLRISVVRAGSTVPEIVTSDLAATLAGNKTPYDDRVQPGVANPGAIIVSLPAGTCSNNADRLCNPRGMGDSCVNGGICNAEGFVCSLAVTDVCDPSPAAQQANCDLLDVGTCLPSGFCSGNGAVPCNTGSCLDTNRGECTFSMVDQRFKFNNATNESLSAASLKVLNAGKNTLSDLCNGDSECITALENGVGGGAPLDPPLGNCPGDPLGLLGTSVMDPLTTDLNPDSTIFGLDLRKGDTLIVEARLSDQVPADGGIIPFISNAGIQTMITVDGVALQANEVVGNLSSTDPDGPAITFSFTSQ